MAMVVILFCLMHAAALTTGVPVRTYVDVRVLTAMGRDTMRLETIASRKTG